MPDLSCESPEADLVMLSFPRPFTWEILQAPLFASMNGASHLAGVRIWLQATLGDVAIVLAAFWGAALIGGRGWHNGLQCRQSWPGTDANGTLSLDEFAIMHAAHTRPMTVAFAGQAAACL